MRPTFLFVLLLAGCSASAQTGPAGVLNSASNVFWVKGDAGTSSTVNNTRISFWNDQSGNNINTSQVTVAQQPSFATSIINNLPAVQFDNVSTTNDKLIAADNSLLDNTSGYTFFLVVRTQTLDGNARSIISKRTNVGVDQSFMHFLFTGNRLYSDIQTNNDRYNTAATFSINTNYIITQQYDGTLAIANRCRTYVSGSLNVTSAETSSLVLDNNSPLLIGSTDAGDARPFGGYIAEVVIYRTALTAAPRIIVENYLSAKYDIANVNDRYAGDNAGNGDYDRDVAGIGQEASGSSTSFSPSISRGIGISVNSGLDNVDYIMAGHSTTTNSVLVSDVGGMTGTNNSRWQRIWYIDVTNTSTSINVNLSFDFSDANLTAPLLGVTADYVLLYRAGQTGNWTELSTASSKSGDVINFENIIIASDGYYTLGTKNYFASPLPLELIQFSGKLNKDKVELSWETATEKNTSHFILEQSVDGVDFFKTDSIAAAGNSNETKRYTSVNKAPDVLTYYRLTSVDKDMSTNTYPIIAVYPDLKLEVEIFPVPILDNIVVRIQSDTSTTIQIVLISETGALVFSENVHIQPGKNELLYQPTLLEGKYHMLINYQNKRILSKTLIK